MAKAFELKGFQKVAKKFEKLPEVLKEEIDMECLASALNIEKNAKRDAPKDTGFLANMISHSPTSPTGKMDYKVYSGAKYSAYVEFGTGALVDVPAGLENYAMQFKGEGKRQVNLPARPFFFPNVFREEAELVKRVKAVIKSISKK